MQDVAIAPREEPQRPRERLLADYMSEPEYCKELNISERTARQARQLGEGPPYVRFGRQIFYSRTRVLEWLKSLERTPVRSGRKAA